MAKNTKELLSDVEIIRRRDGVVDGIPNRSLNVRERRALADARLRALALTLKDNGHDDADGPDDTQLLEYLLDTLSDPGRHEVEQAIRGNVRAFGRLMTLRLAFNTVTDKRDRHRAEDPARKVSRHTAQRVDVRCLGGRLQFRTSTTVGSARLRSARTSFAASVVNARFSVARLAPEPELHGRRRQLKPGPKTGMMLSSLLGRASETTVSATHLLNDARTLFSRWEGLAQQAAQLGADERRDRELQQVSELLVDMLLRLQRVSNQFSSEIWHIVDVTVDAPPFEHFDDALSLEADMPSGFLGDAPVLGRLREPYELPEEWSFTKRVEAGPWSLMLQGDATASSVVIVTVQDADKPDLVDIPILTLVQRNQGFVTANVDAAGRSTVDLPAGESILLVQGKKEIWQIPFTVATPDALPSQ